MKRKIAIFGPPGVGKSTLIKLALKRGIEAYDFEDFSSKKEREEEAKKLFAKEYNKTVLFNSADMQPGDFPEDVECVLLLPPKDIYLERMKKRDNLVPKKEGQGGFDIYDGFSKHKNKFHKIIEEVATPDEILDRILK